MRREVHERRTVQELMNDGVQLVEVLPRNEYGEDHLPGAIHVPLRRIEADATWCGFDVRIIPQPGLRLKGAQLVERNTLAETNRFIK